MILEKWAFTAPSSALKALISNVYMIK